MSKFIAHGIITEEPVKKTFKNGIECVTVTFEEVITASYKQIITTYKVDFMGACTKCVPSGITLVGAPVVVVGSIRSHIHDNRPYYDLVGEQFSMIAPVSMDAPTKAEEREMEVNLEKIEIDDDDLPF